MRGLACALFATCAAAKVTALAVAVPGSTNGWLAWLADDAALALVFAVLTRRAPRALALTLYAVLAAYTALNAAVVRAVGTALVLPMLRGVDAAMTDSVARYLEAAFMLPACMVLATAGLAPFFAGRAPARVRTAMGVLGLAAVAGHWLPHSTHAAHRNAVVALARSALPRSWMQTGAHTHDLYATTPARREPGLATLGGAARGRSVVVVVLESAAARFLRPYGAAQDPMPFVTEMAGRGVLCAAAWAVYPESIKGQLALWHSVPPAPDASPAQHARVPVPGLAALLAHAGYATSLFHAGRFRFLGMDAVLGAAGFDTLVDAARISGERESSFGVDEESTVAALLHWVDSLPAARPFLAAYLPIAGHHPYSSPPGGPFRTDNQLDCYRNALHYADRNVRALWEGLCRRRAPQSLLLCVVGDHGQAFGEHDGNFGHTFALYEENLHVPLLFVAPGATDHGAACGRVVTHLDVAPTLLDLLALPPCAEHRGASILRGETRLAFAFTDWGEQLVAVRDQDHKYVLDLGTGTDLLFDLRADPGERHDLAREQPDRVAGYRRRATAWITAARRSLLSW